MNKNDNLDNQNPTTKKYLTVYLIIFGALLLCFRAFQNHYPLLYSDTGTYIRSGFLGTVPLDRPIIYGLFLRHISLSVTPWLVIFTQGLLISILMYLVPDRKQALFKKNGLKKNIYDDVFLNFKTFFF